MEYKRTIEIYKTYYIEFYKLLPLDVRTKVNYVLELIRTENVIPEKYFKHLTGIKGLNSSSFLTDSRKRPKRLRKRK